MISMFCGHKNNFMYFQANIGKDVKSSKFIRALVTALVESQTMSK